MFGTEELFEAEIRVNAQFDQRSLEEERRDLGGRTCALARALINYCEIVVPSNLGEPTPFFTVKPDRERMNDFKSNRELPKEYRVENLRLHVSTMQVIDRYFELLFLDDPEGGPLFSFLAKGESGSRNYWSANETFLRGLNEVDPKRESRGVNRPIAKTSPEYTYIKSLTGLFLPQVLEAAESHGA